ncbi:cobyrinate a,c-diamide synthase [Marininema halotolerans]|uniref:Cobyrinate a,c-diamide synthase n=1 Tax=Marininema halotolerans TaxID=1155944 RepID=A0A1I6QLW6_9BACL|nr:cobyrinate a,c-diamide synthase [Marininema halotolerans]SFS53464.1 cobyrinic acid a,c-diamide synthase [Marininema halotolerans]
MSHSTRPRLVIAGTGSGAGKTTVTLGLMAAFTRRGKRVQGFKIGPDYLDPSYHTAVTKRPSRNLDTWMMSPEQMLEVFIRGGKEADLSIIEGVMGMYDGKDPMSDHGSTADVAIHLESPIILVMDIGSMARSAAAIVRGFQSLNPRAKIAGVFLNRAGSEGHYQLCKAAIEKECQIPVVGWLGREEGIAIPERHLGLIPAVERGDLDPLFDTLAHAMEKTVDLDQLEKLATTAPTQSEPVPTLFIPQKNSIQEDPPVIAVARDAAFNFYYPENLELLEWYGATLCYFSPLEGEKVPVEADGLMIGGGFPEEYVEQLASQEKVKASIRERVKSGMPTFAECGGFMVLCERIRTLDGRNFPMVGLIPATVTMTDRLAALGYREVRANQDTILLKKGESAKGHEFRYSTLEESKIGDKIAYESIGRRGATFEGYVAGNLLAGYTHLHFASNGSMVQRWLETCRQYRKQKITQK